MRLLITEFICGGGLANDLLPESLQQEGQMMLQALLNDCLAIKDYEVIITLDSRVSIDTHSCKVVNFNGANNYFDKVVELADQVDYVWVVAPESDDILETFIRRLENNSVKVINCDAQSIRLCADQLRCVDQLQEEGVNVVPTLSVNTLYSYFQKVLIKPRNGVGCEGVQVFTSGLSAINYIQNPDLWIVQPYIQGDHCSMSLLCYAGEARILTCNQQVLSNPNLPTLTRCIVNVFPANDDLVNMANSVARAFPGLQGYVGVDFIQTKRNCVLVEVNPRLTTSYIGLSKALQQNPAQLCLDAFINASLPNKVDLAMRNVEVVIR